MPSKPQVEDHQVVLLAQQMLGGVHAVVNHGHLVAGAGQPGLYAAGDLEVVFDQQDSHGGL
jgi:hypothetical protein